MSNQSKMVVITGNEDFAGSITVNKAAKDIRIVDFDVNETITSMSMINNNLLDLTVLAQFSELNSAHDQLYKTVLNSRPYIRSKSAKVSKSRTDLVCVICGDDAIGFNYDALTCASCKAFFRRNAQYTPEKLRCRSGLNKCSINYDIHRKCQRCRLEKCFVMGMRKDFILSEEEKLRRRQRLEENRQTLQNSQSCSSRFSSSVSNEDTSESVGEIDRLLMDTESDSRKTVGEARSFTINVPGASSRNMSTEDWLNIENVTSSYLSIFRNQSASSRSFDTSDRISALISWSEFASQRALKLINFFQHIEEFEKLNNDDRFILIKYNLLPVYLIQKCLYYNPSTGTFSRGQQEDVLKRRQFFALCYGTSGIRETYLNLMRSLAKLTEQDSVLINLLLVILLFSKGLSMNESEPLLHDVLAVYRAQSHYIRLTWNYLMHKQGEMRTIGQFTQLFIEISRIQSFAKRFRDFFRIQIQSKDTLERFAPLMQAVLNLV